MPSSHCASHSDTRVPCTGAESEMAEKIPWSLVVHTEAKLLARYLRGEISEYAAFLVPS